MTKLVVSVSLLFGVYQGAIILFPPDQGRRFPGFYDGNAFDLGVVNLQWHDAFTIVAAIFVALFLRSLLFGTRTGIAMRAVVDDRPLAQLTGSRPDRSAMLAWALGTSLAALSGILLAGSQGVLKHLDLTLLVINAYAAAMIGRLRSLPLTFVGALILGLGESYAVGYLHTNQQVTSIFGWNDFTPISLSGLRPAFPVILLFIILLSHPAAAGPGRRPAEVPGVHPDAAAAPLDHRHRRPRPAGRGRGHHAVGPAPLPARPRHGRRDHHAVPGPAHRLGRPDQPGPADLRRHRGGGHGPLRRRRLDLGAVPRRGRERPGGRPHRPARPPPPGPLPGPGHRVVRGVHGEDVLQPEPDPAQRQPQRAPAGPRAGLLRRQQGPPRPAVGVLRPGGPVPGLPPTGRVRPAPAGHEGQPGGVCDPRAST